MGPFSIQTSPYTLPVQMEGVHNVTVRAFDVAGNYRDETVDFYIDSSAPEIEHVPVTSADKNSDITIVANITDLYSGVGDVGLFYKSHDETNYTKSSMASNDDTYTGIIPASVITTDLEYYIAAEDNAVPVNIGYYGTNGRTLTLPTSDSDINIEIDGSSSNGHPNGNGDGPGNDNGDEEDDSNKNDSSWLWAVIFIVVAVIVIILLWLMFVRKKRVPTEQVYQPDITGEPAVPPQEPADQPQPVPGPSPETDQEPVPGPAPEHVPEPAPEPATDAPQETVQPPPQPQPPPIDQLPLIRE
jgi:hypothetical protein